MTHHRSTKKPREQCSRVARIITKIPHNLVYFRFGQVRTLVWRQFVRMIRDPLAVKAKLMEMLFIAIWYGVLYHRADNSFSNDDFRYTWTQVKDINVNNRTNV